MATRLRRLAGGAITALLISLPAHADERIGHRATVWERGDAARRQAAMRFGDEYRAFIDAHRTEREFVRAALAMAKAEGFREHRPGRSHKSRAGDRLFRVVNEKALALVVVGKRPISEGTRVLAAHIDAVRIDIKQNPVYADANLALLQTHYYGGIKRYQWMSMPLELRGVVIRRDGRRIDVRLGADPDDPVLVIPDLLAHLSHGDVDSREGEAVPAEALDPVAASIPAPGPTNGGPRALKGAPGSMPAGQRADDSRGNASSERLRRALIDRLAERFDFEEADFLSAELQLVPAMRARDVGLDRAMIGAYGQDDRSCGYAALRAVTELGATPEHTAVVLFLDKEEIGSTGNTGARSTLLRSVLGSLLAGQAPGGATEQHLREALARSMALSIDVTSAANPHYTSVHEAGNVAYLGSGPVVDHSGAHAEFKRHVVDLLLRAGVLFQTGLFSKVTKSKAEEGTVLPYLTDHGMDGMDFSLPLLSMHSPYELISKADLHEALLAYRAFLLD